jgi:hypothetical protein
MVEISGIHSDYDIKTGYEAQITAVSGGGYRHR